MMNTMTAAVRSARSGDRRAFDTIVHRFQDMAVAYARAQLGDRTLAEDAAQESFLEAYRSLSTLESPDAFPCWFRMIVQRQCSRITRRKRLSVVSWEDVRESRMPLIGSPQEALMQSEERAAIHAAIGRLPEGQRVAVSLYYMAEHSQCDIAAFLGITENAVKKRLQAARSALKEMMLTMTEETLREERPSRDDAFENRVRFFLAVDAGDAAAVADLLARSPALAAERRERDATTPPSSAWGRKWGITALHLAAGQGDTVLCKVLIDMGADLEAEDLSGDVPDRSTPLQWAARAGKLDTVRLLVERGANVNAGYDPNLPAAAIAAVSYYDHRDVAEYLLDHGARPNIFTAVALGREDLIRELAASDPGVLDALLDEKGRRFTPLHLAARKGLPAIADLLITLGARRDARDAFDRTAIDLALTGGKVAVYEILIRHGAEPTTIWRERCGSVERAALLDRFVWACGGDIGTVSSLLAKDPTAATAKIPSFWPDNYCGATALHFAAWTGQREIAQLLLDHGADLDARDEHYGGSPAEWAEENHRPEMAEWLRSRA